jgi:hypothetical protein
VTRDELRAEFERLTNELLRPPHADVARWRTEMLAAADQYAAHMVEEYAHPVMPGRRRERGEAS